MRNSRHKKSRQAKPGSAASPPIELIEPWKPSAFDWTLCLIFPVLSPAVPLCVLRVHMSPHACFVSLTHAVPSPCSTDDSYTPSGPHRAELPELPRTPPNIGAPYGSTPLSPVICSRRHLSLLYQSDMFPFVPFPMPCPICAPLLPSGTRPSRVPRPRIEVVCQRRHSPELRQPRATLAVLLDYTTSILII